MDYLGATLDDVTGSKWTAFVHPEDVDGIVAQWRACLVSGENFEYETRIRRANGEYRWHLVRGVPLRDEAGNIVKWYGVVTDIEDRKRAEDKIREQESELRQIVDLVPQLVSVFGPGANVFMPTALGSITSALVLKSGGKHPGLLFLSGRRLFILMTENVRRALIPIVLAPVAPLSSWSCGYANVMAVIAGSWFVLTHCATNRDRLRVGMLP